MCANAGIWFVPFERRTFELLTDPFSFIFREGKNLTRMEDIINDFIARKEFPKEIELNQMATLWESYIKETDALRSINCKKDFTMGMFVIMKRGKKRKEKNLDAQAIG